MDPSGVVLLSLRPSPPTAADVSDTASKFYWGPRLWRLLHLLADISDRRDIPLLWPQLMRCLVPVIPCDQCRHHLADYLRTHTFMKVRKPHLITGVEVRTMASNEIHSFHNNVNRRLGKPEFPHTELATLYGAADRSAKLSEIQKLYEELKSAWAPLTHSRIPPVALTAWKSHMNLMITLISAGPS